MTLFVSELSQNGTTVLLDIKDSIKYTLPSKIDEGSIFKLSEAARLQGSF